MIGQLLRSFLLADTAIAALADEVAVGFIPTDADGNLQVETYIWLSNFSEEDSLALDGTNAGLTEYRFDVECCSTSISEAKQLARLVKKLLQGFGPSAAFGTVTPTGGGAIPGRVAACYITSKDDTYTAINSFINDDITVVAQDLTIFADDSQDDIIGA